jgi:hypothetical protein
MNANAIRTAAPRIASSSGSELRASDGSLTPNGSSPEPREPLAFAPPPRDRELVAARR